MPASLSAFGFIAVPTGSMGAQGAPDYSSNPDCGLRLWQQPIQHINPLATALTTLNSPRSPSELPFDFNLTHPPHTHSQHVRVNLCPSSPNHVSSSSPLESPLSTSSNNVSLKHYNLASRYGFPLVLPKPPSTRPRSHQPLKTPSIPNFDSILRNYLSMISQPPSSNPSDDTHIDNMTGMNSTLTPDSTSPMFSDFGDDFLTSPHNDFLTSPLFDSYGGDFSDGSPSETPLDSFLTTPIFQDVHDPLVTGEDFAPMDLFGGEELMFAVPSEQKLLSLPTSVDPSSLVAKVAHSEAPVQAPEAPIAPPATKPGRKPRKPSAVTGTRKNISPETMVPLDAPTQTRKYTLPSATSRKEIPSTFLKKKRSRSQAFSCADDDQLDEVLPLNATEAEQIEFKRRQNTLAARKSRKRKLEHQMGLETRIEDLQAQLAHWKARAEACETLMKEKGLSVPSS